MPSVATQGTILKWSGADVTGSWKIRRIGHRRNMSEIDVTSIASSEEEFLAGYASREITVECYGTPSIVPGDTGTLEIAWNTGTTIASIQAICISAEQSGEVKGAITTSYTFKKTPSA